MECPTYPEGQKVQIAPDEYCLSYTNNFESVLVVLLISLMILSLMRTTMVTILSISCVTIVIGIVSFMVRLLLVSSLLLPLRRNHYCTGTMASRPYLLWLLGPSSLMI